MRIAIISDIHGNLEALNAALTWIEGQKVDEIVCLGDIVGYGANPAECVELIRSHCRIIVKGNHDEAVTLGNEMEHFNPYALRSILWTRQQLSDEQLEFLSALPMDADMDELKFVHASPDPNSKWEYIFDFYHAEYQFKNFTQKICFYGHTHIPVIFPKKRDDEEFNMGNRYLINVGSIGQPRDHDPRSAFGLFDTEEWQYYQIRASYDIAQASAKIIQSGLPSFLAERLFRGR